MSGIILYVASYAMNICALRNGKCVCYECNSFRGPLASEYRPHLLQTNLFENQWENDVRAPIFGFQNVHLAQNFFYQTASWIYGKKNCALAKNKKYCAGAPPFSLWGRPSCDLGACFRNCGESLIAASNPLRQRKKASNTRVQKLSHDSPFLVNYLVKRNSLHAQQHMNVPLMGERENW